MVHYYFNYMIYEFVSPPQASLFPDKYRSIRQKARPFNFASASKQAHTRDFCGAHMTGQLAAHPRPCLGIRLGPPEVAGARPDPPRGSQPGLFWSIFPSTNCLSHLPHLLPCWLTGWPIYKSCIYKRFTTPTEGLINCVVDRRNDRMTDRPTDSQSDGVTS